jgi:hypothetical protein
MVGGRLFIAWPVAGILFVVFAAERIASEIKTMREAP